VYSRSGIGGKGKEIKVDNEKNARGGKRGKEREELELEREITFKGGRETVELTKLDPNWD
jgi:hypothetical protein